jgi:FKBP-type peptidyl-prolyl cis-trans isomerase
MRKISNLLLTALFTVAMLATTGLAQQSAQKPAASTPPAAGAAAQAPSQPAPNPALPTQKDKISYAIGMNIGKQLHQQSIDVDTSFILQGLKDALAAGKMLMTDDEAQSTLIALQTEVREREVAKRQKDAETNKKASDAFLAANKSKPGVTTLPSGLQYKVLKEGTGPKPAADDVVETNYKGTLINGTEFDSSFKRGETAKFPVNHVIKGWTEALVLMPVGSKWELYVPPDMAYGERGAGDVIGPNEALVFEVELISIQPRTEPAKPAAPGAQTSPGAQGQPSSQPASQQPKQ